eukprot:4749532-Pleurochrysis_carterae.AAC.3
MVADENRENSMPRKTLALVCSVRLAPIRRTLRLPLLVEPAGMGRRAECGARADCDRSSLNSAPRLLGTHSTHKDPSDELLMFVIIIGGRKDVIGRQQILILCSPARAPRPFTAARSRCLYIADV